MDPKRTIRQAPCVGGFVWRPRRRRLPLLDAELAQTRDAPQSFTTVKPRGTRQRKHPTLAAASVGKIGWEPPLPLPARGESSRSALGSAGPSVKITFLVSTRVWLCLNLRARREVPEAPRAPDRQTPPAVQAFLARAADGLT